jgi:hypothetical protein
MRYSEETEKGKTVTISKTGVFRRSLKTISNNSTTFTDHSRNKFGVNNEILIYTEIIFFGGLRIDDGG